MFKPAATQIESRPNFSSLTDEAPSEVKFTAPYPQGSYVSVVQPGWRKDVNKLGTEFHEFQLKLLQAFEDVNAEELREWTREHGDISAKLLKRRFFITTDAVPYLDEFHEACGLDLVKLGQQKVSRLHRNDMVGNCYVGVYLKHRMFTDGSNKVAVDIDRFFAVQE